MADQPPPPPPHGTNPRSSNSNLPPGNYDIFIIPPHSAGSGFLYLPSLKPNVNSFAAGFASALMLVILFQSMAPAFKIWWSNFEGMGNAGMMVLVLAVGVGAWALGRTQKESDPSQSGSGASGHSWRYNPGNGGHPGAGHSSHSNRPPESDGPPPPPPPHGSAPPPPPQSGPPPNGHASEKPKSSWQQRPEAETTSNPEPEKPKTSQQRPEAESTKGSWEKAREETRKKEEERKAKEAEQRKRDEIARRLKELREKEARERARREQEARERREKEARERDQRERESREREARETRAREEREREIREKIEREAREREAREKQEREARDKEKREQEQREREQKEKAQREKELKERRIQEARERELRERLDREKALREKLEREAKERENARKAAEEAKAKEPEAPRKSTYAFSSVGEKTNPWPNGKPPMQPPPSPSPTKPDPTPNAARRPPPPTAKTFHGTDDDAYSFRPYDQPKAHRRRRSGETVFTESSYAPSHSTSRTTPPPSMRGPYTTKDPDKIVIKAVYQFLNQFSRTPASQLISGCHPVTDGLILRITTEGLFIDDDVRGVPQREWDVKAWTLNLMEVFCPSSSSADSGASSRPNTKPAASRFRFSSSRGQSKTLMGDDADKYLDELLHSCDDDCRPGPHHGSDAGSSGSEWKHRGLHVLRATIRDQEGKRYLFVLGEEEGWKVVKGLQRLRKGIQARLPSQVRQLGILPMSISEARSAVEMLGW